MNGLLVVNKLTILLGAGAAGASMAHHLRKYADDDGIEVNITVFERSSHIGGRSTTVNAWDDKWMPIELGASIFVSVNEILVNATKEFGLSTNGPGDDDEEQMMGIWDGEKFVFIQSSQSYEWWNIAKMIWKYGYSAIRARNLMKATVGRFLKLYEEPYFPFRSLSNRAEELRLLSSTGVTGEQLLKENKVYAPFTTDIIQASTRVNYGQNLFDIHGLGTMVCLAIDGAMQVEGGNWQIFHNMIAASNASVYLNTAVSSIEKAASGKLVVSSKPLNGEFVDEIIESLAFDSVVLAAPLQFTDIKLGLDVLDKDKKTPDEVPYVKLHVTLFATPRLISGKAFGLKDGHKMPDTIMTTIPADHDRNDRENRAGKPGFFSISTIRKLPNSSDYSVPQYIYKIFSPAPITSDFLSTIFDIPRKTLPDNINDLIKEPIQDVTWFYPKVWYSYPYEFPRVTFEDIELGRGFYYTSGIESFISTMETSALMGKNVARLIMDDFVAEKKPVGKQTGEQVVLALEEL